VSLSEPTRQTALQIYGDCVNNPVYLISAKWRNNPNGVRSQLKTYGFEDVETLEKLLQSVGRYINGSDQKGLTVFKMFAQVPVNLNAAYGDVNIPLVAALQQYNDYAKKVI